MRNSSLYSTLPSMGRFRKPPRPSGTPPREGNPPAYGGMKNSPPSEGCPKGGVVSLPSIAVSEQVKYTRNGSFYEPFVAFSRLLLRLSLSPHRRMFIYFALFLLGAILGALVNDLTDRLGWEPKYRSPWRTLPAEFSARLKKPFRKTLFDFLPIVGWLSLRRINGSLADIPNEDRPAGLTSETFWRRPFLVEILSALGFCLLYYWEVVRQGLLPPGLDAETPEIVCTRLAVHFFLLGMMLLASLIDFDDMVIPESLTVFGTILGLVLVAVFPNTLLPVTEIRGYNMSNYRPILAQSAVSLTTVSPFVPKTDVSGYDSGVAVACWCFFCFAMMPRVWYQQLPLRKASAIFCRYLIRSRATYFYLVVAVIGSALIFATLNQTLYTGLVGMTVGMITIWCVRMTAHWALGREAMGFGDVTLMGMLGVYLGWQSMIVIFFLAAVLALMIIFFAFLVTAALSSLHFELELPFGPYLCLAALLTLVGWRTVWGVIGEICELGGFIIGCILVICLGLFVMLLLIWRAIKRMLFASC